METSEVLEKLKDSGSESIKKVLLKHGAREPLFGVKVENLKKIQRLEKGNNALALALFDTGNYDAMYLARLIADGSRMTPDEIDRWAQTAYGGAIGEYTVPWVAAENKEGYSLALSWIGSPVENIAVTGWATLSSIVSVWPDQDLDTAGLSALLTTVEKDISQAPGPIKLVMNGFVIAAGSYVLSLYDRSLMVAGKIGRIDVTRNGKACKVPLAAEYITKICKMGRTGRKRATAKC
ncbi:MAG TPA: hypothetical protein PLK82_07650 [Bacteroidales bacterium]|nr:hypothetical protein [Bacteroidales bacterium]